MSDGLTIFLSLGGSVFIGLIVTTLFNSIMDKFKQAKEAERRKDILELKKEVLKEQEIIKAGLQASIRNDLYVLYYSCKQKNCASYVEKRNFDNMYNQYHQMGQNGVMDNIRVKMMELPEPGDEKDSLSELSGEDLKKYVAIHKQKK